MHYEIPDGQQDAFFVYGKNQEIHPVKLANGNWAVSKQALDADFVPEELRKVASELRYHETFDEKWWAGTYDALEETEKQAIFIPSAKSPTIIGKLFINPTNAVIDFFKSMI